MSDSSHDNEHKGVGHIVPVRILITTGTALLILTALTVWSAGLDFGNYNIVIALVIAFFKGSLVVLFFMHLRYDRPFNGIIFITAMAFVVLFISLALLDTKEYAKDMYAGEAPIIQEKLDDLAAAAAAAEE